MRTERQKLKFTKMHGCQNDYIYFNCFEQSINNPEGLSVSLSDRHLGIGGDGVVLICPSEVADAKMRMFNLDGSEGKMCGNAIRCVGKYVYDNNIVKKEKLTIETLSGIKEIELFKQNGEIRLAKVDMGKAELKAELIPVNINADKVINYPVDVAGGRFKITCVSMGNPHCVVFNEKIDGLDLEKIGPKFENDPLFPERVNTEFVKIIDRHTLKMRVWERGSGETWACGTGACAAVVAAVENGYCEKDTDVTVRLKGGNLIIRYTDDTVYMTGNAETIYDGVITI